MCFSPSALSTGNTISPAPNAARRRALLSRSVTTGYQDLPEEFGTLPSNFHHAAYLPVISKPSKVNPRRQRRPPVLLGIKLRAPTLDKLVEALALQQLIQTLIERMPGADANSVCAIPLMGSIAML
jgi:hypothetical protein